MIVGIFGTGRNGSTLLTRLLDGSPDLWVHPLEVNYLSVVDDLHARGRIQPRTSHNARTSPIHIPDTLPSSILLRSFSGLVRDVEVDRPGRQTKVEALLKRLGTQAIYNPVDFLLELLEGARRIDDPRGPARKILAFKSIETPYVADYESQFPDMRFIHIIRDPVSTYASLKRTNMVRKGWPFWQHGGDELRTILEMRWIPHAAFLSKSESEKHHIVRYEPLCANPELEIDRICSWLGVRPPAEPTRLTSLAGSEGGFWPNPSAIAVETPERVVKDMASTFRYEDVVTDRERAFIWLRTASLAERFGYTAPTPISRWRLFRRWMVLDEWDTRNARGIISLLRGLVTRRVYIFRHVAFSGGTHPNDD